MCEMKQEGQFSKNNNLLLYAIQLVSVMKWNKRGSFQKNPINDNMLLNLGAKWKKRGSFQKTTIYYCMLFNLFAYWNETRRTVFKNKTKNTNLLQYVIQLVCILKWNKMVSFQKNPINDNMLLNLCAKWNKRGSFQKTTIYYSMLFNKRGIFQKTTIYYCMIFNLCAYWNETRGTVFKKKPNNLLQYAIQQEGHFSKNNNLLLYDIQLVCVLKWNKMDSYQKNPIDDNMLLNSCAKWNKRGSFQKPTIYYCMLFNLCAYWNETRGTVFKNKTKNTNLLQYTIQQAGQFWKTTIYYCMIFNLCAYWNETRGTVFNNKKKHKFITVCYSTCARIEMKQEGQFSKTNNLLQYAIQLVCILKWNKRDSFQKTTQIYYCMLFNLCVYWNETRG